SAISLFRIPRRTCIPLFFFQAEDGIRDFHVTGVQTCALPIFPDDVDVAVFRFLEELVLQDLLGAQFVAAVYQGYFIGDVREIERSEERRVGKECRRRKAAESKKEKDGGGVQGSSLISISARHI